MSKASHSFARRKPHHRVIIARGEKVHSFTIRPWLVATVGGVFLAFSALYLSATGYLVFRDDLLAASLSRQARMQTAYEDRIATLRADIDRLTSRQLLNQEAVEAEVERLVGRQAALDARQDVLAGLSQAAKRAGIEPEDLTIEIDPEGAGFDSVSDPKDPMTTGSIAPAVGGIRTATTSGTPATALDGMNGVAASLDALAEEQVAYVDAVAGRVGERTDRIAGILKRLGHSVPAGVTNLGEVGGPFVAIDPGSDPDTFRANVDLITGEVERFATVRRFANQLPLSQPVPNATVTSPFGARMDPFVKRPAMHTGIDIRAAMGSPARASVAGTVITAAYSGSYGNMVEIDHGNGITTRFAHMSRIDVAVGQVVQQGTIVGRAGSTGRSTGPHLHYEIRIDGAAIDPLTYIRAGKEIAPLL